MIQPSNRHLANSTGMPDESEKDGTGSFGNGLMNPPLSKKLRKSASSRFPQTDALTATSATR